MKVVCDRETSDIDAVVHLKSVDICFEDLYQYWQDLPSEGTWFILWKKSEKSTLKFCDYRAYG